METSPVSSIPNEIFAGMAPPFIWTAEAMQQESQHEPGPATDTPTNLAHSDSKPDSQPDSQADSSSAREQVLLTHLPLVRFVARKIHERLPQYVEMEDMVSAGIVGLIDAFNKFDAGKNVQFRSYAQFRIRGAILDSLRTLDWGPRTLRRKGRSVEEAMQKLTHCLRRSPLEGEVAAELGMELGQYQELLGQLRGLEVGSLQETRAEDSAEEELACLPTAPEEDPLYRCMKSETCSQLRAAIADLPEREGRVLALYYVEEMTQKEIGVVLGLVESRVSQIRVSAVTSLRARLTASRIQVEIQPKIRSGHAAKRKRPMVPAAVIQKSIASSHAGRPQMAVR